MVKKTPIIDLAKMIQYFLINDCNLKSLNLIMIETILKPEPFQGYFSSDFYPHFTVLTNKYYGLFKKGECKYSAIEYMDDRVDRVKRVKNWVLNFNEPSSFSKLKEILLGNFSSDSPRPL